MSDEDLKADKRAKLREQAGVLLIVVVLVGSGFLLLNNSQKQDNIDFVQTKGQSAVSQQAASTSAGTVSTTPSTPATVSAKININTASIEDLDNITGVGPATAQKIIDYRTQNGGFKSIEEIKEVSGIGDAKYAKMKDQISI